MKFHVLICARSGSKGIKNKSFLGGKVDGIEVPNERSIDLDAELDFKLANMMKI